MPEPITDEELLAYREAVARWGTDPNPTDARLIVTNAAAVLTALDNTRKEERHQRETAEAASSGWRIEVAEVERLRAERDRLIGAARHALQSLDMFIQDSADPGTQALGDRYTLAQTLLTIAPTDAQEASHA